MSERSISIQHNGVTYVGKFAMIKSTMLGYEDHGIFTSLLSLDMGGSGVGFGQYTLDEPEDREDHRNHRRVGTAYGLDFIIRTLETVGVSEWEQVKGSRVLALFLEEWGPCKGIANLMDESRIFIPSEHFEQWKADHS